MSIHNGPDDIMSRQNDDASLRSWKRGRSFLKHRSGHMVAAARCPGRMLSTSFARCRQHTDKCLGIDARAARLALDRRTWRTGTFITEARITHSEVRHRDRKSVVEGKSVSVQVVQGGRTL